MFINKNNQQDDIELINLKTASSNYELALIEGILKDNSIPYIIHENESGAYMRIISGSSLYGTDIYVEKNDYEKANALIAEILGEQ